MNTPHRNGMEYHASLFLSQPNSNSAHFSVLLFYEHCANVTGYFYFTLDRIKVLSREEIAFELKCGLTLKERI